jgi:hypothetical protein
VSEWVGAAAEVLGVAGAEPAPDEADGVADVVGAADGESWEQPAARSAGAARSRSSRLIPTLLPVSARYPPPSFVPYVMANAFVTIA